MWICSRRPQAETQTAAASVPAEEAHLERNLEKLLESIAAVACADRAAHAASSAHAQRILPFAAFKLTAIAPPRLLVCKPLAAERLVDHLARGMGPEESHAICNGNGTAGRQAHLQVQRVSSSHCKIQE